MANVECLVLLIKKKLDINAKNIVYYSMKKLIILLVSFLFIGCEGFPLGPVNMHLGLCGDPNAINYDYGDTVDSDHCEYCGGESSTDEEMYEYCCLIPGASNYNQDYVESLMLNEPYYIPQDPTWCIFEE